MAYLKYYNCLLQLQKTCVLILASDPLVPGNHRLGFSIAHCKYHRHRSILPLVGQVTQLALTGVPLKSHGITLDCEHFRFTLPNQATAFR